MTDERPIVYVIDDDPSARRGLSRLIQAAGMSVQSYGSAQDFLDQADNESHGCIVLDVKMPELSGLDLQAVLQQKNMSLPIIFVSGHSEIPDTAVAMKRGAIDFLTKPVDRDHLFKAIAESLEKDRENRKKFSDQEELRKRIKTLSPREYTVLRFVITGMLNKQIAYALSITEDTVKVHRRRAMRKMGAGSVAELVRFCEMLAIEPAEVDDV